jgi:hypothetical protein|tara:strand:+ start:241 stop:507 length:267 start_codon:yes stop_codon:yes gene_type:complete
MKKLIILITTLMISSVLNAEEKKPNCSKWTSKLKAECNFIGDMKEFSSKHKTIGQSIGLKNKEEKKTLREFSKENKTIDQTIKNILKK